MIDCEPGNRFLVATVVRPNVQAVVVTLHVHKKIALELKQIREYLGESKRLDLISKVCINNNVVSDNLDN